ncbi:hypothetical protein ACJJTC_008878 [Scirpophaga incertulas]
MLKVTDIIDLDSCRICLSNKKPLSPLFKYQLSGNYAEMLTAVASIKVASNDGLPEKICKKCCSALEKAYLLKTIAERTDRKLQRIIANANKQIPTKKIAFDTFTDIKSEIGPLTVKSEPKWEFDIDTFKDQAQPVETVDGDNLVIANTVIRKVEGNFEDIKPDRYSSEFEVDITLNSSNNALGNDVEFFDDDAFQDDDDDADYIPPENIKSKFKKPKLSEIKVFKDKKPIVRKVKVVKKFKQDCEENSVKSDKEQKKPTMITCYPILKNGSRGPPVLLKRPKDATVLKIHPNCKVKTESNNSVRMVRSTKQVTRPREKLVCPICGILTYTLGNHISTHEGKKFSCSQCPKTFSQKSNLLIHSKQHTGIKDHICEVCGSGFYSQKSLVRHNLIHKGDRPFPCSLCNKRFIVRCDLTRHLRIHSGYKPFKCSTCTMSFNAKHQLQNHERMHTGERPYVCEVCNVAFSYKVNLNNHVFKVHGVSLKFKSIHRFTQEVLQREMEMVNETTVSINHIMPPITDPIQGSHNGLQMM